MFKYLKRYITIIRRRFRNKMSDTKFLDKLKEAKISQDDALKLLIKEGKLKELKTREEIEEESKPKEEPKEEQPKKQKKARAAKEDKVEKEELEKEEEEIDLDSKFEEMEKKILKTVQKALKIPGKTPSEGKETPAENVPEGAKPPIITANKFEVRV